jgi:hypothetical protein
MMLLHVMTLISTLSFGASVEIFSRPIIQNPSYNIFNSPSCQSANRTSTNELMSACSAKYLSCRQIQKANASVEGNRCIGKLVIQGSNPRPRDSEVFEKSILSESTRSCFDLMPSCEPSLKSLVKQELALCKSKFKSCKTAYSSTSDGFANRRSVRGHAHCGITCSLNSIVIGIEHK